MEPTLLRWLFCICFRLFHPQNGLLARWVVKKFYEIRINIL